MKNSILKFSVLLFLSIFMFSCSFEPTLVGGYPQVIKTVRVEVGNSDALYNFLLGFFNEEISMLENEYNATFKGNIISFAEPIELTSSEWNHVLREIDKVNRKLMFFLLCIRVTVLPDGLIIASVEFI